MSARSPWHYPLYLAVALLLAACFGQPQSGPVEVKWDRDVCTRCSMVLSDRFHSAQLRAPRGDRPGQVYKFDDLGCALLWLDGQPWRDHPGVEIWVNDHRNGDWIDARTAFYIPGQVTPMEYGLGAQAQPAPGALTFAQARQQVFELEARFNTHGIHLRESARERHDETQERRQ